MVSHESEREILTLNGSGLEGVQKQILAGPRDGYRGFLREFTLSPAGHTPFHSHSWTHLIYVLGGSGRLSSEGREHALRQGSVVFIAGGKEHGIANTGRAPLRFLCLVPEEGDEYLPGP